MFIVYCTVCPGAGEDGTDEDGDAPSFLKFVLTSHPGLKERKNRNGETPLHSACRSVSLHVIGVLCVPIPVGMFYMPSVSGTTQLAKYTPVLIKRDFDL